MKPGDRVELTETITTGRNRFGVLALARTRGTVIAPCGVRVHERGERVLVKLDTVFDPRRIPTDMLRLVSVVERLAELP